MLLESLDQISQNDFLTVLKGPKITYRNMYGEEIEKEDNRFNGTLLQVAAISPPYILVNAFVLDRPTPVAFSLPFHRYSFIRVNKKFIQKFLKLNGYYHERKRESVASGDQSITHLSVKPFLKGSSDI